MTLEQIKAELPMSPISARRATVGAQLDYAKRAARKAVDQLEP